MSCYTEQSVRGSVRISAGRCAAVQIVRVPVTDGRQLGHGDVTESALYDRQHRHSPCRRHSQPAQVVLVQHLPNTHTRRHTYVA